MARAGISATATELPPRLKCLDDGSDLDLAGIGVACDDSFVGPDASGPSIADRGRSTSPPTNSDEMPSFGMSTLRHQTRYEQLAATSVFRYPDPDSYENDFRISVPSYVTPGAPWFHDHYVA